jgi:hypothetical protein
MQDPLRGRVREVEGVDEREEGSKGGGEKVYCDHKHSQNTNA